MPGVKVAFSQAPGFSCTISCITIAIFCIGITKHPVPENKISTESFMLYREYCIFIEDQAFSPAYDLAATHPTLFPPPVSNASLFLSLNVCLRSSLRDGEKALPSINHSIFSDVVSHFCKSVHLWTEGENCTFYKRITYIHKYNNSDVCRLSISLFTVISRSKQIQRIRFCQNFRISVVFTAQFNDRRF